MRLFLLQDPRQSSKVQHGLAETLVIIVCGPLVGADTLVEIEFWAQAKAGLATVASALSSRHSLAQYHRANVESARPARVRCRLSTLDPWSVPSVSRSGCH